MTSGSKEQVCIRTDSTVMTMVMIGHGTPTVRRAQDRSGQAELRAQQAKELLDKCIADYHSKYGAPMVSLTKSPVIRAH